MSTYVNPRPQPVRVQLSDGSERIVGPWGLAFLPDTLHMVSAEYADHPDPKPLGRRADHDIARHRRAA